MNIWPGHELSEFQMGWEGHIKQNLDFLHNICMIHTYTRGSVMSDINKIRESTRKIIQHLGYMNNMFSHIGSVSQCYALQKIEAKSMTILELSQALSLEHSSASRIARELVNKGYCKYIASTKDKRNRCLALTKKGKKKTEEIHNIANQQVDSALKKLTRDQKKTVLEGMQLYAEALKNIHNGE